jgi:hypothetical protein
MRESYQRRSDWRLLAAGFALLAISMLPFLDLPPSTALTIILVTASIIFGVSLILSTLERGKQGRLIKAQGARLKGEDAIESDVELEALPNPIDYGFDMPS